MLTFGPSLIGRVEQNHSPFVRAFHLRFLPWPPKSTFGESSAASLYKSTNYSLSNGRGPLGAKAQKENRLPKHSVSFPHLLRERALPKTPVLVHVLVFRRVRKECRLRKHTRGRSRRNEPEAPKSKYVNFGTWLWFKIKQGGGGYVHVSTYQGSILVPVF